MEIEGSAYEMLASDNPSTTQSRLCHAVALLAALCAVPLLLTGAEVTTYRVGMAVPDWPTTFGVNMFLYNYFEAPFGVVIEHRHRLFGSALGVASIVLAIWFVTADPRRWMKALGVATLAAVSIQGIVGGMRVLRNSTTFAAIHGCTGQAVFALLIALCVFTGRDWASAGPCSTDPDHLRRRSLVTLLLIYAQIVVGATLRHFGANLVFHMVLAGAVWGHVAWLMWRIERIKPSVPSLVGPLRWMAVIVSLQIALGIAAWWVLRPFDGIPRYVTRVQAIFRSGHVVNGAMLLAASLVVSLRAFRHLASPVLAHDMKQTVSALAREAVA